MVSWISAKEALCRLVPATEEMIAESRQQLEQSNVPHAAKEDYWPWYEVYLRLTRALLRTFDLKTMRYPTYYGFAREISKIMRTGWQDETKQQVITDIGRKWKAQDAQPEVLGKIFEWAMSSYALRTSAIKPDPKPNVPTAAP
jgi:hypothetical protein